MTTSALIMMISVQVIVAIITGYFFFKVLNVPKNTEEDNEIEKS